MKLSLRVLNGVFSIAQMPPGSLTPTWLKGNELFASISTPDEVSIVCDQSFVPENVIAEKGWKAIMIQGPLDFSLVGVMAELSQVLAVAGISIFALSTYNTDYVLVRENDLDSAVTALRRSGFTITGD
jgi:hypothetical protein